MQRFRIHHRHEPSECGAVVASWRGFSSPLRHEVAVSSCPFGGHEIWWDVDGVSEAEVLARLPPFVARRSTAIPVGRLTTSRVTRPIPDLPEEESNP